MRALAVTRNEHQTTKRHLQLLMVLVYFVAIVAATTATTASAQRTKKDDPKLKPRPVTLQTKDGLSLRAYYFPSQKGKEAPTVLLVHGWNSSASPYQTLARALNRIGCAVLIPDYRGHGGSKEYTNARGKKDKFNSAQMSKRDVENIISFDLEKAKGFLKDENNDGYLNLNALVVIGIEEGCVMAARWAQRDWSFPSVGNIKQGQDVKALIFISPNKQIKGVGIDPTLTDGNLLRLPTLIIAGASSPEASEAKRIHKRIEAMKKRFGRGSATGISLKMFNVGLSGPALIKEVPQVGPAIGSFINSQVKAGDGGYEWSDRQ